MATPNYIICARKGCDEKFLKRVHNQKFHDSACCQIVTNERILSRYYENKKPVSKNRVCKKRGCTTVLSMYNKTKLCESCARKDQEKLLNRKMPT